MTKKTRNRLFALFILAFPVLVLFWFVISESIAPLPPTQPLPNPNGYDDFLAAGKMLDVEQVDYLIKGEEELRRQVSVNAGALALARRGLTNECRVPIQYDSAYNSTNHLSDLSALKILAFAFMAEGRLAEMENHPSHAVKSYLDTMDLGIKSAHGGLLIDQLVGIAIEANGRLPLGKNVDLLDAKTCRETAVAMEALDARRQTWPEVVQQEQVWSRRTFPGLRDRFAAMLMANSLKKNFDQAGQKFAAQQLKTRQLIVRLATRAYELDKGKPPANLSDLVPEYLKAVPQDPLTGMDVTY